MSYDLLAFEPAVVTDADFPAWWDHQSQWHDDHDYNRADAATPAVQTFYTALRREYPPMNGPYAPSQARIDQDPGLDARLTDYSIGTTFLYAAFPWSQADAARDLFQRLAREHGLAVAMVSDDGRIIRP